jgi:serine/threonine-protein kinase
MGGKFRLERLLGVGGMGAVYEAKHEVIGSRVALKLLLPTVAANDEVVTRFKNEARALLRLECEHVVRVMDVGTQPNGAPFIVMEFLEGIDLRAVLAERGPLPVAEAVDYLLQTLVALSEAHAVGIVHRDLKPSNLFLSEKVGRPPVVKVLDFGVSKISSDDDENIHLTTTRSLLGSPLYMAPEQIRKSKASDPRSDLWSFGVVAYELLSGKTPFDGENMGEVFAMILETTAPSLTALRPDLPPELAEAIHRCLERDPERRWTSAADVARILAPFGSATSQLAVTQILQRSSPQFVMAAKDVNRITPVNVTPPPGPAVTGGSWSTTSRPRPRGAALAIVAFVAVASLGMALVFGARWLGQRDAARNTPPPPSALASAPPPAEESSPLPPSTTTAQPPPTFVPVVAQTTTAPREGRPPPPVVPPRPPTTATSAKPPPPPPTTPSADIFGRH